MAIRFDYLRGGRQVSWRRLLITPALLAIASLPSPSRAQYPVQMAKPQDTQNMRAVGVLEWTGDEQHPKASRMVPVTVYDGQELQDAGIYLARPAPLALTGETEYELKDNGKTVGLFDINGAGQEQGSWVGFGVWKPLSKPKPAAQSARPAKVDSWGDDTQSDRPVLHRKPGSGSGSSTSDSGSGSGAGSGSQAQDPDRPTLHKKDSGDSSGSNTGSTTSSTAGSGSSTPSDPDRPTLHKKTSSDSADSSGDSTNTSSSGPAPDPDRPTLHKKASDDDSAGGSAPADPDRPKLKKNSGAQTPADVGYVESLPNISDPDRPKLQRGKVNAEGLAVLPTLMGLPPDMHQEVAVSDAKSRPEHLWTFSWANPDDEGKMKADMEDLARKALGIAPPPAAPVPAPKRTTTTAVHKKVAPPPPPPPAPLLDEQFRVFELAYGSGATMVLSAHTDGQGAKQKFVTIVAQPDLYGNVVVLLKSVTDAAHLDDTPRMRLVDAVDAMADNRGELLFELRGATERKFALYRVLRGQADRLFVSGPGTIATEISQESPAKPE